MSRKGEMSISLCHSGRSKRNHDEPPRLLGIPADSLVVPKGMMRPEGMRTPGGMRMPEGMLMYLVRELKGYLIRPVVITSYYDMRSRPCMSRQSHTYHLCFGTFDERQVSDSRI